MNMQTIQIPAIRIGDHPEQDEKVLVDLNGAIASPAVVTKERSQDYWNKGK
jgi:hypothetical protein